MYTYVVAENRLVDVVVAVVVDGVVENMLCCVLFGECYVLS